MPGYDNTGPVGEGPQTGRGLGPCGDDSTNTQTPPRRFLGRRFGFGRSWRGFGFNQRRRFYQPYPEDYANSDVNDLKSKVSILQNTLKTIQQKLSIQEEKENKGN